MIDISEEKLVSLADAAKTLPGRPHVSTIWRWHTRGIRGIRLETVVVGGRRFTSRESLQRFAEATTAAADGAPVSVPAVGDKGCARSPACVERMLDAAGF